jgi:hypothetical protein
MKLKHSFMSCNPILTRLDCWVGWIDGVRGCLLLVAAGCTIASVDASSPKPLKNSYV